MTDPTITISPPTFEPWDCYSIEQLQAIIHGWQWILAQPGWAAWHQAGETCIAEIEAELERRSLWIMN